MINVFLFNHNLILSLIIEFFFPIWQISPPDAGMTIFSQSSVKFTTGPTWLPCSSSRPFSVGQSSFSSVTQLVNWTKKKK
jgi:hypothetical protein